jgi:hypothetical protein
MLQPAIDAGVQITRCCISYELEDGIAGQEACWWDAMALLPHILNLLGKKVVRTNISFGKPCWQPLIAKSLGRLCITKYFVCTSSFVISGKTTLSLPWGFRSV